MVSSGWYVTTTYVLPIELKEFYLNLKTVSLSVVNYRLIEVSAVSPLRLPL